MGQPGLHRFSRGIDHHSGALLQEKVRGANQPGSGCFQQPRLTIVDLDEY